MKPLLKKLKKKAGSRQSCRQTIISKYEHQDGVTLQKDRLLFLMEYLTDPKDHDWEMMDKICGRGK